MRNKVSHWQSDFTTEVTIAPSQYRFRDFADEKYLKRFVLNFHQENGQQLATKTAKDQSDLRQVKTPPPSPEKLKSLRLVFKPLDREESMATREKAFKSSVNRQWVDPNLQKYKDRRLRMAFPDMMQQYEPKPKLFVKNIRSLKSSDYNSVLGEYIDPRPCVGIDRIPSPMKGMPGYVEQ